MDICSLTLIHLSHAMCSHHTYVGLIDKEMDTRSSRALHVLLSSVALQAGFGVPVLDLSATTG